MSTSSGAPSAAVRHRNPAFHPNIPPSWFRSCLDPPFRGVHCSARGGCLSVACRLQDSKLQHRTCGPTPFLALQNTDGLRCWGCRKAGVLKYLMHHHEMHAVRLRGTSAGALIATLAACNVDLDRAVSAAHDLAQERGVYDRRVHSSATRHSCRTQRNTSCSSRRPAFMHTLAGIEL